MAKATKINLLDFKSIPMRTFHLTWLAFFLCFFGWFGVAPMLVVIREDLGITTDQIVTTNMIAVASTVFMRLIIGWLCDRIGPRKCYSGLLILGSIPVMLIGTAETYEHFLMARMFIGCIGASFVITQFHTSIMFDSKIVGTANATTAGWGNMGGGVTQQVMPFVLALFVGIVGSEHLAWRYAMVVPGIMLFIMGFVYMKFTKDTPEGNYKDVYESDRSTKNKDVNGALKIASKDYRVWLLFLIYGGCFGVELIVNSKAALYFVDYLEMDVKTAGIIAGCFGLMNLFARSMGGFFGDKFGATKGLNGRVKWLFFTLLVESFCLMLFSRMEGMVPLILSLIVFSLFVQMSEGATFSVVPFINKKALGSVSGIVGAGGNAGAVAGMLLFKKQLTGLEWNDSFLYLGFIVFGIAFTALFIKFSKNTEAETAELKEGALTAA